MRTKLPMLALVLGAAIATSACRSTRTGDVKVIPTSAVAQFQPIEADPKDTCATKRQIAEHNSVYDTLRTGKTRSYRADCGAPKSKGAAPAAGAPKRPARS